MRDVHRKLTAIMSADVVGYAKLVGEDEVGTIEALRGLRRELVEPSLDRHEGRMVKLMGDGLLAEFPSVVEAVDCAIEIQTAMAARRMDEEGQAICFRVGINLGDVVIDGDDIQGDGVNLASRLEEIATPGGVCISDVVYQIVHGRGGYRFEDMGAQNLKNIEMPIRVWRWRSDRNVDDHASPEQQVQFCRSRDGTTIAYATVGAGPPLFKAPNWMNHLEYDWRSLVWGHLLRELAADHTLVRFDQRGNGLSDWDAETIDADVMIEDMEAVVSASGLERFPLIGISQGCAYSIDYAAKHPERVSRLVLYGGFLAGAMRRGSEEDKENAEIQLQMIARGWGKNNPAFRQFFTSLFVPGASKQQMDDFNELQRMTASPENAARLRTVTNNLDVVEAAKRLAVPTLVIHCRGDGIVPFDAGRKMATVIPGARFVALEGQNHLMLEDEPAFPRFLEEVRAFLAEDAD